MINPTAHKERQSAFLRTDDNQIVVQRVGGSGANWERVTK